MKRTIKTEIEYEDAPSGYVTFYNYKEPLMKFDGGYGYIGALLFDGESEKIQCHLCGEWFGALSNHLAREHNMSANSYKEVVGLLKNTALLSESAREKLIASGLKKRMKNLKKGTPHTKETKEKIRQTLKENATKAEGMNLRGTCPAQLLDRMHKIFKANGGVRKTKDFNGFEALLRSTFGSVKQACVLANIPYTEPCYHHTETRIHTEDSAKDFIREYIINFEVRPSYKDFKKQGKVGLYNSVVKNSKKLRKLTRDVYAEFEEFKYSDERYSYTDAELLDFLVKFEKIHKRRPALSDSKRCLLPYPSTYIRRFKSWNNALKLAFND